MARITNEKYGELLARIGKDVMEESDGEYEKFRQLVREAVGLERGEQIFAAMNYLGGVLLNGIPDDQCEEVLQRMVDHETIVVSVKCHFPGGTSVALLDEPSTGNYL